MKPIDIKLVELSDKDVRLWQWLTALKAPPHKVCALMLLVTHPNPGRN